MKKLEIVICDDMPSITLQTQSKVKEFLAKQLQQQSNDTFKAEVSCYSSQFSQLIDRIALQKDDICYAYFLDIDLRQAINGLQLARQIRNIDPSGTIVFFTSYQNYMPDVFKDHLRVLDYIIKGSSNADQRLEKAVAYILNDYISIRDKNKRQDKPRFTFTNAWVTHSYDLQQVMYIWADQNRKLKLFTSDNQTISFYDTLKEIEHKWEQWGLVRCHKECIVNINKIVKISRKIGEPYLLLDNGAKCKFSRTYYKNVLQQMNVNHISVTED